jgi:hypothetical protein
MIISTHLFQLIVIPYQPVRSTWLNCPDNSLRIPFVSHLLRASKPPQLSIVSQH